MKTSNVKTVAAVAVLGAIAASSVNAAQTQYGYETVSANASQLNAQLNHISRFNSAMNQADNAPDSVYAPAGHAHGVLYPVLAPHKVPTAAPAAIPGKQPMPAIVKHDPNGIPVPSKIPAYNKAPAPLAIYGTPSKMPVPPAHMAIPQPLPQATPDKMPVPLKVVAPAPLAIYGAPVKQQQAPVMQMVNLTPAKKPVATPTKLQVEVIPVKQSYVTDKVITDTINPVTPYTNNEAITNVNKPTHVITPVAAPAQLVKAETTSETIVTTNKPARVDTPDVSAPLVKSEPPTKETITTVNKPDHIDTPVVNTTLVKATTTSETIYPKVEQSKLNIVQVDNTKAITSTDVIEDNAKNGIATTNKQEIVISAKPSKIATTKTTSNNAYSNSVYAQQQAVDAQNTAAANKSAVANVKARSEANSAAVQSHANTLANHESRITALESESNNAFRSLKSDVESNRKRAAVGIASVAAMSNIPQVTDSQNYSVGVGVGSNDAEGAVAVGFSARVSEHVVTKASVGAGSYGGATVGAGVSFGW
ncbi:YadA-like family protein [Cronobacter muytjensii]|nr:YadA-like family protein [Cronobacter muytjensii]